MEVTAEMVLERILSRSHDIGTMCVSMEDQPSVNLIHRLLADLLFPRPHHAKVGAVLVVFGLELDAAVFGIITVAESPI